MTKEEIQKEPLFPILNIQSRENDYYFSVSSVLRIKNSKDGKYYLQYFLRACKSGPKNPITFEEKSSRIQLLITDVYYMMHVGLVDLNIKLANGDPCFYLDDNQQEEFERVKNFYI